MVESEKGVSDILVDFEFEVDLPRWIYQWEENNFNPYIFPSFPLVSARL